MTANDPGQVAAMRSGVRPSSERAFTSAPPRINERVLSRSFTAHIRAVAPASLRTFGSAPASRSRRTDSASAYGAVTGCAVYLEQRLDVPHEVDLGRLPGGRPAGAAQRREGGERHLPHTASGYGGLECSTSVPPIRERRFGRRAPQPVVTGTVPR